MRRATVDRSSPFFFVLATIIPHDLPRNHEGTKNTFQGRLSNKRLQPAAAGVMMSRR
jgi:hypothetical protein